SPTCNGMLPVSHDSLPLAVPCSPLSLVQETATISPLPLAVPASATASSGVSSVPPSAGLVTVMVSGGASELLSSPELPPYSGVPPVPPPPASWRGFGPEPDPEQAPRTSARMVSSVNFVRPWCFILATTPVSKRLRKTGAQESRVD